MENMVKIFLFLLLEISKNHSQINFGRKFSSNTPTRDIPKPEVQKEYLSENAILNFQRVRDPELSGTLPQQVLIRVRDIQMLKS